jgi:septum site-determining protein MinC
MITDSQHIEIDVRSRRATVAPFQIRGRFFTAIVLQMNGGADGEFYRALDVVLAQAPQFFANAPFVLDLDNATGIGLFHDFAGLTGELRKRRITLIGVQNGTIEQNRGAVAAGLIPLQGGRDAPLNGGGRNGGTAKPAETRPVEAPAPEPEAPETPPPTLMVTEPVRSGQQVFAETGDLIVVASVSSGAELIARGNIHVYGAMRGRALAGVYGDPNARIFCQSLEAELIAIDGLYKISDDFPPSLRKKRVQAFLKDGFFRIEPLK